MEHHDYHRTEEQDRLSSQTRSRPENCSGATMKIVVNDQVHLSEFRSSDKDALIELLNDRNIYNRTLRIPFPYTSASFEQWMAIVEQSLRDHGQPVHWAIRDESQ